MTKNDKYKPTTAEKKLLEVLLNPENIGKSVTELCTLAKISRNKYYDAMRNGNFVRLVNDTTLDLIKGKIHNVLNATYTHALNVKGHQDRKLLLTMAGLYSDKVDVKADVTQHNPLESMTTDEIKKVLKLDG